MLQQLLTTAVSFTDADATINLKVPFRRGCGGQLVLGEDLLHVLLTVNRSSRGKLTDCRAPAIVFENFETSLRRSADSSAGLIR